MRRYFFLIFLWWRNTIMNRFLNRNPESQLAELLSLFIHEYKKIGLTPKVAKIFYQFVIASYKVPLNRRYSISMLAEIFNTEKVNTNLFLNIYAHSLYCLAMWNKEKIYEEFIP